MAYDMKMALMAGTDIPIPECQLTIHQPTIAEIALIGDEDFFIGIQTLTVNKNMISDQDKIPLEELNNFHIFMMIIQEKEMIEKKEAVKAILQLICPDYTANFTPRSLLFGKDNQMITIDESNFEAFQNVIGRVFCINSGPMDTQNFNPANQKAKEIADKLMRGRQRVAAQKTNQNESIFVQYLSVLTVGIHSMTLKDCLSLTMYQLFDLVERYMLYVNWDLDIRSRLAGGKPEREVENWMKNIH